MLLSEADFVGIAESYEPLNPQQKSEFRIFSFPEILRKDEPHQLSPNA